MKPPAAEELEELNDPYGQMPHVRFLRDSDYYRIALCQKIDVDEYNALPRTEFSVGTGVNPQPDRCRFSSPAYQIASIGSVAATPKKSGSAPKRSIMSAPSATPAVWPT